MEETLNILSLLYNDNNDILFNRDLFEVYKIVTLIEKEVIYMQINNIKNIKNKEYIRIISDAISEFKNKYDLFYISSVKNKIIFINIYRKVFSIVKGAEKTEEGYLNISINDVVNQTFLSKIENIIYS